MAAEVETMMYVREVPWHGLGKKLEYAPTSKDAIIEAELDWNVESRDIYDANGNVISGYKANTRDIDDKILGIVSNKYKIVQNADAFDFTDSLVGEGMTYETAGSLCGGKKIWLLGKLPDEKILGEDVGNYICFMNTHDGMGAIKVCMTPVRVVCNNTLNFALNTAKRMWSTKHMGDMNSKLAEAQTTLGFAKHYMQELDIECDKLANKKISDVEFESYIDELFPVDLNDDTQRKIDNANAIKAALFTCLAAADVAQYRNSAYGKLMAVTDFVSHNTPLRNTDTFKENNWKRIINGHPLVDNMYKMMAC